MANRGDKFIVYLPPGQVAVLIAARAAIRSGTPGQAMEALRAVCHYRHYHHASQWAWCWLAILLNGLIDSASERAVAEAELLHLRAEPMFSAEHFVRVELEVL